MGASPSPTSPFTEEALEAFFEASVEFGSDLSSLDFRVFDGFLGSLPSAARFACRAALDAETMIAVCWAVWQENVGIFCSVSKDVGDMHPIDKGVVQQRETPF